MADVCTGYNKCRENHGLRSSAASWLSADLGHSTSYEGLETDDMLQLKVTHAEDNGSTPELR